MKEIADGLVRAKKLEKFAVFASFCENLSLSQCISNLAFIPNLKSIDFYECNGYYI